MPVVQPESHSRPTRESVSVSLASPASRAIGTVVGATELSSLGLRPLKLQISKRAVMVGDAVGCEWTTIGEVPDAGGLYACTLQRQDSEEVRVAYVGMTTHLWMVTKGFLQRGGGARGGQRYGRPIHAGTTRQRINVLMTPAIRDGWTAQHWVKPFAGPSLGADPSRRCSLPKRNSSRVGICAKTAGTAVRDLGCPVRTERVVPASQPGSLPALLD